MRLVKMGLAQVNTTVGAFQANTDRALEHARALAADGCTLAVFQEQVIGGYPTEDLVHWPGYVRNQWPQLLRFARETAALPCAFVLGVAVEHLGVRLNCAALVAGGRVLGLVPKEKLPNYNVFYEARTWGRGWPGMHEQHQGVPLGDHLFQLDFGLVALEVCEDLWSAEGPIRRRAYSGAELVVNVSASPFRVGFVESREELLATRSADYQCTLAYCNALGSNDGLIFDGGGWVYQNGRRVLESPRFKAGHASVVVDLDRTLKLRSENSTWRSDQEAFLRAAESTKARVPVLDVSDAVRTEREALRYPVPRHRSFFLPPPEEKPRSARERLCEDLLDALALGVGDYFEKTRAFRSLGLALSGGRDSLLTLLIAHRYASRARPQDPGSLLQAFYMPSRFSSAQTREAAETICRELGVPFKVVGIDDAFERELEVTRDMLQGAPVTHLTEQNIQARLRAQRMWNWSNSSGALFLQTGNMSERAVGYTTVGGDLMGALAVIANVPKTVVNFLLDYLQEKTGLTGIAKVLAKPAGPELAHGQVGEEELMPFPVLDACFHLFADEKMLPDEVRQVVEELFPELGPERARAYVEKFVRLFLQSIYKWVQAPLSLHVGGLDLDRERALQLPVVTSSEWTRP